MKNLTKILFIFTLICFFCHESSNLLRHAMEKNCRNYSKGTYKSNLPLILEIQNRAIKEDNAILIMNF
jgi:hypothetical protein